MSKQRKFESSRSSNMQIIERMAALGLEHKVLWRTSSSSASRHVCMANQPCLNFGTCSYLGLHIRSELMNGAIDAIHRFGTQFSSSRAYNACNIYSELESGLEQMTGRNIAVAASTTLLHMAAIPALVSDNDFVIIDQFAHASLHMATDLLGNTNVARIRHSHVQKLELMIQELENRHERIWYIADGLYSMRGDYAPFRELTALLDRYQKLHVYLDDAHSTGWYGECGRGAALSHLPNIERVVVALSLNKSFSAAGGALALATPELKKRIYVCGGTILFSGPIQPPMLGAAVASVKLHVSRELPILQANLQSKIEYTRITARQMDLKYIADDPTPIFFLPYDSAQGTGAAAKKFWEAGIYVCPVWFPAVPVSMPGIRFSISTLNEIEDIDKLLTTAKFLQPRPITLRTRQAKQCRSWEF